jgi:hypothetical protein
VLRNTKADNFSILCTPRHVRRTISAYVDRGLSRGSRVGRDGSEDPHRRHQKFTTSNISLYIFWKSYIFIVVLKNTYTVMCFIISELFLVGSLLKKKISYSSAMILYPHLYSLQIVLSCRYESINGLVLEEYHYINSTRW